MTKGYRKLANLRKRRRATDRKPKGIDEVFLNRKALEKFPTSQLVFERGDKGFVLKEAVRLKIILADNSVVIRALIPEGYSWDGASIPYALRWLVGGKLSHSFALPSLLHDFVIEKRLLGHLPESELFLLALRTRKGQYDIPRWKESLMFTSVLLWSVLSS